MDEMHSGQLYVDEALAAELIATSFASLADAAVCAIASPGTTNAIFRIGVDHVARFPLAPTSRSVLEREADAVNEFSQFATVPSPRVVHVSGGDARYSSAWSVHTWISGTTAAEAFEEGADSHDASLSPLADDIAALIHSLRKAPLNGRSFDGGGRGGDMRPHDEWVAYCLERSVGLFDTSAVGALWQRLSATPHRGADVMSHRDLIPTNIIVGEDANGFRLTGVIDGGSFGPADPALDLVIAWHLFGLADRRRLRGALGSGDDEWRRGAAWALQQAVGLCWYYLESNPVMSRIGRKTIRQLLADPDL